MSISEKISRLSTARTNIQTAIRNKGVAVDNADGFEDFASKINLIQTGGGGSVTANFNIAKIVKYISAQPTTINISGCSDSSYNGDYVVTAATTEKQGFERVYKHSSNERYLYCYVDFVTDYYWCLHTNSTTSYGSASFRQNPTSTGELATGEQTWTNSNYNNVKITTTISATTTPEIQGYPATNFSETDEKWSFGTSLLNFNEFESTPLGNCLYVYNSTSMKLIGNPICAVEPEFIVSGLINTAEKYNGYYYKTAEIFNGYPVYSNYKNKGNGLCILRYYPANGMNTLKGYNLEYESYSTSNGGYWYYSSSHYYLDSTHPTNNTNSATWVNGFGTSTGTMVVTKVNN